MFGRVGILFVAAMAFGGPTSAPSEPSFVSSRIEDRIVKRFDFDERKLGNFEQTPMNWRQIAGPGYPRFLDPRFDAEIGLDAPPSFRLSLCGGSLACRYLAKDIPVHPDSDYRISVWVHTSGVVHAKAYISAYFLDHALQRIEPSTVRSAPVRSAREDQPWQELSLLLPGGYEKARWIGLSCHLEQPSEGNHDPDALRPIEARDPLADAWFDDISVVRLPRVSLHMEVAGSVFTADQPVSCSVRVADVDGRGLTAALEVRDVEGNVVESQPIPIVSQEGEPCSAKLGELPPGQYIARLMVSAEGEEIVENERAFVRLGPDLAFGRSRTGRFGLILDPMNGTDHRTIERLVGLLRPDVVKLPLWERGNGDEMAALADERMSALVRGLNAQKASIVGILAAPPAGLAEQFGHRGLSIVDVLAAPANQWRPYLASLFSRFGERVSAWQIGSDRMTLAMDAARMAKALASLRESVQPLTGSLQLAIPLDATASRISDTAGADIESRYFGAGIGAEHLSEQLGNAAAAPKSRRWITLEALDAEKYPLRCRLREEARRMVVALQSGAETIFVPQPWVIRDEGGESTISPGETFTLIRTLRQTLGNYAPMGRVWLDHGVSAWLFGDAKSDEGALVVWTDGDEATLRSLATDVAPFAKAIDLWGVSSEGRRVEGGKEFTLGPMPIVLAPVSPKRVRTMASFAVSPANLTPAIEEQRATVSLHNDGPNRLVGFLRLKAPASWRITPREAPLDLLPGQSATLAVSLRLPSNQAAGDYVLEGRYQSAAGPEEHWSLRAPIFVSSSELDVKALARSDGAGLRIVQRVTNRSRRTLDLRSLLIAPQHQRQVQSIRRLAAGQSVVREFQIDDATALKDRYIRVSVEQVDGPIRHNDVIKVE